MDINNLVRENIKRLKPYSSARGKYTSGILLDANENPLAEEDPIDPPKRPLPPQWLLPLSSKG